MIKTTVLGDYIRIQVGADFLCVSARERLLGLGMEAGSSTPEQLGTMTRDGLAKMTKLIKGLGIKAE